GYQPVPKVHGLVARATDQAAIDIVRSVAPVARAAGARKTARDRRSPDPRRRALRLLGNGPASGRADHRARPLPSARDAFPRTPPRAGATLAAAIECDSQTSVSPRRAANASADARPAPGMAGTTAPG